MVEKLGRIGKQNSCLYFYKQGNVNWKYVSNNLFFENLSGRKDSNSFNNNSFLFQKDFALFSLFLEKEISQESFYRKEIFYSLNLGQNEKALKSSIKEITFSEPFYHSFSLNSSFNDFLIYPFVLSFTNENFQKVILGAEEIEVKYSQFPFTTKEKIFTTKIKKDTVFTDNLIVNKEKTLNSLNSFLFLKEFKFKKILAGLKDIFDIKKGRIESNQNSFLFLKQQTIFVSMHLQETTFEIKKSKIITNYNSFIFLKEKTFI